MGRLTLLRKGPCVTNKSVLCDKPEACGEADCRNEMVCKPKVKSSHTMCTHNDGRAPIVCYGTANKYPGLLS